MTNENNVPVKLSNFLKYLAEVKTRNGTKLPPLKTLSTELGMSVASLREQLEVARVLGFVEIHPKKGIRLVEYKFRPTMWQSLSYAMAVDATFFQYYSDLRAHIETAYWLQAVELLTPDDIKNLQSLVDRAFEKLHRTPPQIPHWEHRQLHMSIYGKLNNPFVIGLLEAYWDLYETFGLDVYTDFNYLERVWIYHRKMVDAIAAGNFPFGHEILSDHMALLLKRPTSTPVSRRNFE